jgi:hypothetical protein
VSWQPPAGEPVLEPGDSPIHPMAPWFATQRRRLRGRPGPRRPPRRAVITMVHDEPVFLPLWLAYYSRWFAPEDIYVLDNDTTDGTTDRDGFVRVPAQRDAVDHEWMVRTIEGLQHELLDAYDVVLVTDVDELVAPSPALGTLGDYLDHFDEEWVNCLGYEVLHARDTEPPLDLRRPVLEQRGQWFHNGGYDKAALATVPLTWRPGFHGRADFQYNLDPDLRLIHLHRMDYDICLQRHRTRDRRPWAPNDAELGWAAHNRITDEAAFARWFDEDSCFEEFAIQREPIPASWRGRF